MMNFKIDLFSENFPVKIDMKDKISGISVG